MPWFIGGGNTLELGVHSGGVQTGDNGSVSISHTSIVHNAVTAVDLKGEPEVFDGGILQLREQQTFDERHEGQRQPR